MSNMCKFIPGSNRNTSNDLYSHCQLTCLFSDCGRRLEKLEKLEKLERSHADTRRTCKLHTERNRESNPQPQCCGHSANCCSPCGPAIILILITLIIIIPYTLPPCPQNLSLSSRDSPCNLWLQVIMQSSAEALQTVRSL